MWAQIKMYKTAILFAIVFAGIGAAGYIGIKWGAADVQSKWDKETILVKEREVKLNERILKIVEDQRVADAAQAKRDAESAAAAAQERARLQAQADAVQKNLERLTRSLPQYKECKLDDETLKELNRSLKK